MAFSDMDTGGFNNAMADFMSQANRVLDPTKLAEDNEHIARFNQIVGASTSAIGGPILTKGVFGVTDRLKALRGKAEKAVSDVVDDVTDRARQAVGDAAGRARDALERAAGRAGDAAGEAGDAAAAAAGDAAAAAGDAGGAAAAAAGDAAAAARGGARGVAGAMQEVGGRFRGIDRGGPFGTPPEGEVVRPVYDPLDAYDEAGFLRTPPTVRQPPGLLRRLFGRAAREVPPERTPIQLEDPEFADAFESQSGLRALRAAFLRTRFRVAGEGGDGAGGRAPRLVRVAADDDPGAGAPPAVRAAEDPGAETPGGAPAPDPADPVDAPAVPGAGAGEAGAGAGEAGAGAGAGEAAGEAAGEIGAETAVDAAAAAEGGLNPFADIAALVLGAATIAGGIGAEKTPEIPKLAPVSNPGFSRGLGGF